MAEKKIFYVGTYTKMSWSHGEAGKGLYRMELDIDTGEMIVVSFTEGIVNPSYAAFDKDGSHLYAINEVQPVDDLAIGSVSAYAVDAGSGELTALGAVSSCGLSPCYIAVDPRGRCVFLTNYVSGNAVSIAIREDGSLGEQIQTVTHTGSSIDPRRQKHAYAHSLIFDRDGKHVIVADLGMDRLMVYALSDSAGKPAMTYKGCAEVTPGMGPRHMAFDASGHHLYCICEMGSRMFVYDYNDGALTQKQELSTLPEDTDVTNHCADLHFSSDGRFLYGSNRGHNSIVIYRADAETGLLSFIGTQSTNGQTPRNFSLDPSGRWLVVANQDSNNIVSFAVDTESGALRQMAEAALPSPVLVKFRP